MKERPIPFSAPMVRAILEGRKIQTRRVIKRPIKVFGQWLPDNFEIDRYMPSSHHRAIFRNPLHNNGGVAVDCPHGLPGDQLWVKESYRLKVRDDGFPPSERSCGNNCGYEATLQSPIHWGRLRPSIHMPRPLSRIQLEITGVRVERLQDISGMDAKYEGISHPSHLPEDGADLDWCKAEFEKLWRSINTKSGTSWDENPWVWVINFKRIKP